MTTRDWDAATYDRVSTPQVEWARRVLERLDLRGDETVLDAGCGSGRVTLVLLERLPHGHVVAVDSAPSMVEHAREALGERATVLHASLTELELDRAVDAVFSNAVFHWIADHDLLFARLFSALRPGGRLVAQCGGAGNVERFHRAANAVSSGPPFADHLAGWRGPWNFAGAGETAERLRRAGFESVNTWLEEAPVTPPDPSHYLRTVCLGHHLERLPEKLRAGYVEAVRERLDGPLDYVRLNIDARRPAA
jgi:trans-aconitate 2-methyltransferase